MNQTAIGMLLLFIAIALVLIIFACLYYLWLKTKKLEALAKKSGSVQALAGRADICGYAGKELYEVLQAKKESPEIIEEIKKGYIFYLTRHLEAALEQGMIDSKKSRPSDLGSEMAVGGTRGEIVSWLPVDTLSKFYVFGRGIADSLEVGGDFVELKETLNGLVQGALLELDMRPYSSRVSEIITRKYLSDLDDKS